MGFSMFNFFKNSVKSISASEAHKRLLEDKNIVLLDVRTPEEYNEVHIPNSISLPLERIKSEIANVVKDKDTEIFVYCQSGRRAAEACILLVSMGYTNVRNMGGIADWEYETERG